MEKLFWENGLHFSCIKCSACCRFDPGFVFLSEQDVFKLTKWALCSVDEFVEVYCRWVKRYDDGYEYLSLKEKSNYDCILWKNGCTAYYYRPLQCSSYPFWESLLLSEDNWNAAAKYCGGMNKGAFHHSDEIKQALNLRMAQPYIRRRFS